MKAENKYSKTGSPYAVIIVIIVNSLNNKVDIIKNQSIDLFSKPTDWFLCHGNLGFNELTLNKHFPIGKNTKTCLSHRILLTERSTIC